MTYIISYGKNNIFTLNVAPKVKFDNAGKTVTDFPATFTYVRDVVGKEATIEIA